MTSITHSIQKMLSHIEHEKKGGHAPSLLLSPIPRNNRSRVNALSVLMHSQVQVRSGAAAGRADYADLLARTYRIALLNRCFLQVTVQ